MPYTPQPTATSETRIAALLAVYGDLPEEIAATLYDEDETANPGAWLAAGFARIDAIGEYLAEIAHYNDRTETP